MLNSCLFKVLCSPKHSEGTCSSRGTQGSGLLRANAHHLKWGPRVFSRRKEFVEWLSLLLCDWGGCHKSPSAHSLLTRADDTDPPNCKGAGHTGNSRPYFWSIPVLSPGSIQVPICCSIKISLFLKICGEGKGKNSTYPTLFGHSSPNQPPNAPA